MHGPDLLHLLRLKKKRVLSYCCPCRLPVIASEYFLCFRVVKDVEALLVLMGLMAEKDRRELKEALVFVESQEMS